MSTAADEFLQSIEGELTPDQNAQLLELYAQGDTAAAEKVTKPEVTADTGSESDKEVTAEAAEVDESTLTADNAVILAKDGKHTIGFDKLVSAREEAKTAKAQAAELQQQLEAANANLKTLQEQAQARVDAGQEATDTDKQLAMAEAAIDAGIDPEVFGDFSDEALTKGINIVVSKRVEAEVDAKVAKAVAKALEPFTQKAQEATEDAYLKAIYTAHEDADSIVESAEYAQWFNSQPTYMRSAINAAMGSGDAAQVVEVFDSYKSATGKTQQADTAEAVKAKAAAQVAAAQQKVPDTLSGFPGGGSVGKTSEDLASEITDGAELLANMADWPKEKVEAWIQRQI